MNVFHKVTLQSLKKNKTRTIVTIIGVILSAAMLTAVTTFISSLQGYMLKEVEQRVGTWHGVVYSVPGGDVQSIVSGDGVTNGQSLQNIGYALEEDIQNSSKPYLFFMGMDLEANEMLPITLTSGTMPKNNMEVLLPEHLTTNGGVLYQLGDTLTVTLGKRYCWGEELAQDTMYQAGGGEDTETFEAFSQERTYTVVGFYERPEFEPYQSPGYTVITTVDESLAAQSTYDCYLQFSNPEDTFDLMEQFSAYGWEGNSELLRYMGVFRSDSITTTLWSLASILIVLILFGSVSLIYNAFSISVGERTQQFGLLASIGATRKQLFRTVLFEALVISLIGIPLGILAGIAGMGVTFFFIGDIFASALYSNVTLTLSVVPIYIVITAVLAIVTVFLSAMLPAMRASRMSAIEAIRQSKDVRIRKRDVKTGFFTRTFLGMEATLARKNFKRNRRRYRSTVVSLFLSMVLFISASTFVMYLTQASDTMLDPANYDVLVSAPDLSTYSGLKGAKGVTDSSGFEAINLEDILSSQSLGTYTDAYISSMMPDPEDWDEIEYSNSIYLVFQQDSEFAQYAASQGLDASDFSDPSAPKAIALNQARRYNFQTEAYEIYEILESELPISLSLTDNSQPQAVDVTASVGAFAADAPIGLSDYQYSTQLVLIYPASVMDAVLGEAKGSATGVMAFKSTSPEETAAAMETITSQYAGIEIFDRTQVNTQQRNLVVLINVFSYGFITLISLIACANVFNTISTNINLRRREFAMLRSVGMEKKGFRKMMNWECVNYGVKAILWGLPFSLLMSYLIYRSLVFSMTTPFLLPWGSIAVAVCSVFIVVFATMLYAMGKVNKENTVDVLKSEIL